MSCKANCRIVLDKDHGRAKRGDLRVKSKDSGGIATMTMVDYTMIFALVSRRRKKQSEMQDSDRPRLPEHP